MDMVDNSPKETESAPAAAPAPVASTPEAPKAPSAAPAPVAAAPAPAPAPARVEIVKGIVPQTKGTTPGGWNRFAGYKPGDAKNNKNDRRESKGRR